MVLSPPLATADQIVLQHAELLQVLADVRKRNKGGRNDKHDKARVRFIEDFAWFLTINTQFLHKGHVVARGHGKASYTNYRHGGR